MPGRLGAGQALGARPDFCSIRSITALHCTDPFRRYFSSRATPLSTPSALLYDLPCVSYYIHYNRQFVDFVTVTSLLLHLLVLTTDCAGWRAKVPPALQNQKCPHPSRVTRPMGQSDRYPHASLDSILPFISLLLLPAFQKKAVRYNGNVPQWGSTLLVLSRATSTWT